MENSGPWSAEAAVATGGRIRALRAQRGISLSELARRAGVGKATLSGLETGTRNPTAETLYAIAGQLGVPLAMLLSTPGGPLSVPEVRGTAVAAQLLEAFQDGGVSTELYRLEIRPGVLQTSPAHPAGVVEYLTVFSGTAQVGRVGEPIVVRAGEHASWDSDTPHTYAALGDEPVRASLLIRHPLEPVG
ncbi:helix-turn-helix domain-containing protein [Streptacidiphilus jiangxiensis]|uniref:Transcriptional regulator, contains XRE-family HTH domain n=1 Tax=Streptacidiphilus jiangxiensis TaxID=235985 RepID=A0A1H7KGL9_STRJI|nr:XRE family transcriptional regulator [Streptacidiphilus jiangxiensis]SEK85097.1 Transcriptional regulator, contains XRE-family HTH domain [Streptacidiphilus jiangxiensis]